MIVSPVRSTDGGLVGWARQRVEWIHYRCRCSSYAQRWVHTAPGVSRSPDFGGRQARLHFSFAQQDIIGPHLEQFVRMRGDVRPKNNAASARPIWRNRVHAAPDALQHIEAEWVIIPLQVGIRGRNNDRVGVLESSRQSVVIDVHVHAVRYSFRGCNRVQKVERLLRLVRPLVLGRNRLEGRT